MFITSFLAQCVINLMSNTFGQPLLTDTVNKHLVTYMKERPIILNIQK